MIRARSRATLHAMAFAAGLILCVHPGPVRAQTSADESGWPRQFDSPSGTFVIYQPQPEELHADLLTARAAFSLQKSAATYPTFGVLWFNAHILIDRDSSTVTMRDFDVTKVRLPGSTSDEASRYEQLVEAEAPQWDLSGSFEELQTGLAAAEKEKESVANLDNTPPRILFSYQRAILVVFDGAPLLQPIANTSLERVVNTPYVIIHDAASRQYYLNGGNLWYAATDPLGPWSTTAEPPEAVRDAVPPDTSADDQILGTPPQVLTATEPTELISIDGQPNYEPLVEGNLLFVTNTESDVFREVSSQSLYVLIAGRWFRAPSPDGPWTFVRADMLPDAFRKIPLDSPKANVLASVAGTDQADDAVADAEIVETSAIQRSNQDVSVTYDGDPDFEPIQGTRLQYAVNTDAEVILADGRYYLCDQGVWYVSDNPLGPWSVSETMPVGVGDIPPSCPDYDVRYVTIFGVTPDAIYEGYYPGYLGYYPCYGTVVFGTGYHYRSWHGHHHYYPRRWTWGFYPRYNPWLGRWSFGTSFGVGFLRVGYRWRLPGEQGSHAAPPWFGPGGYHRPLVDRDLTLLRTRPSRRSLPRLPDREPRNLYNRSENSSRVDRNALRLPMIPPSRPSAHPAGLPNDAFAGQDGKVYRRGDLGKWTVNERGLWKPTPAPAPAPAPKLPVVGRPAQSPAARPGARPPTQLKTPPSGDLERVFRARERARQGTIAPLTPPTPHGQPTIRPPERPTPAPATAPAPRHDDKQNPPKGK